MERNHRQHSIGFVHEQSKYICKITKCDTVLHAGPLRRLLQDSHFEILFVKHLLNPKAAKTTSL